MFEKVNPAHPDKVADRIAGAIVDLAYTLQVRPTVAVEVLLGHGACHIIAETSCKFNKRDIKNIVYRICGTKHIKVDFKRVPQDEHLANNQYCKIHCGDNGIFKGVPVTDEQRELTEIAKHLYTETPYDGKYILNGADLIICQSNLRVCPKFNKNYNIKFNPIGYWTGGSNVDSGCTNRKLGSDMGDAVTGGGIQGKDLSKADVAVNIYCHLLAQETKDVVTAYCAIGDEEVKVYSAGKCTTVKYNKIVETARKFVEKLGGFEKLATWGLIA